MIESEMIVPSIRWSDPFIQIGMEVTEFLMKMKDTDVIVQSIHIEVNQDTKAKVIHGIGENIMASENLKPNVKKAATEAEMSKTNLGMSDRIKLDNKLGKLTSTEKKPKKGDAKLVGPN